MWIRLGPRYPISYADWSSREYAAIVRCILSGQVNKGHDLSRLAQRLADIYAPSDVHLLNYAHHGIEIALNIFKLSRPEQTEVILPAYICPSVPKAIHNVGLQIRSVAVQEDLNLSVEAVRQSIGPSTLAVIAPHMYGRPASIIDIEALCQKNNIFLIDDAAQVVGVRVGGRLLGTFGDMGVISFAQSKTIVTGIQGSGGVLLVNRPIWKECTNQSCRALPPARNRLIPLADFLWNYIWHAYTGNTGYYIKRLLKVLGWRSHDLDNPTCISNLEAAIALAQLERLEEIIDGKVKVGHFYHEALKNTGIDFPQYLPGIFLTRAMLRLPTFADTKIVQQVALTRGIETRTGYAISNINESLQSKIEGLIGVSIRADMRADEVIDICHNLANLFSNDYKHTSHFD